MGLLHFDEFISKLKNWKKKPEKTEEGSCLECGGKLNLVHGDEGEPEFLAQCEDCKTLYEIVE